MKKIILLPALLLALIPSGFSQGAISSSKKIVTPSPAQAATAPAKDDAAVQSGKKVVKPQPATPAAPATGQTIQPASSQRKVESSK